MKFLKKIEEWLTFLTVIVYAFIPATIRAIVSIRVLNKTSEEYWFLLKFNVSEVDGNVDMKVVNVTVDYFLVRLKLDAR